MELMSSLFFCALIALLPQALGTSPGKFLALENIPKDYMNKKQDGITNNTKVYNHFNSNRTSNNNRVSDLQSVFMNPVCKECHSCMEQSIKAHKIHSHMNIEIQAKDVPNEIDNVEDDSTHRSKRNLEVEQKLKSKNKNSKKFKTKKNKNNKSFSVTKYSDGGKIYALKVKEATAKMSGELNNTKAPLTTCNVYKVTEYFSCDSPEADFVITEKRKESKMEVVNQNINSDLNLPTDKKEKVAVSVFRKRHVMEESQISENFMPSIEEMY